MRATFETYWAEDAFEAYDPAQDGDRLEAALGRQRNGGGGPPLSIAFAGLDVHPHPHQRRMLEDLMVQRDRHDRHRNLVVAATGTGKTVVAAFDYKALCDRAGRRLSLLFVAHREQILRQSQATFQAITKDPTFGEIHGGGHRPHAGTQVFAMVQSLQAETVASIDPTAYDFVIVDEFHHAEAPSYTALLEHLEPAELLGLTATPERMDGQDVTTWFGGRIAVELRVWEAIDRGYLVPFQYFGVRDTADLGDLAWRRGGYLPADLDRVFTGNDARSKRVVDALERYHADPGAM
jgi:superfamily II DNA or RNA helicase